MHGVIKYVKPSENERNTFGPYEMAGMQCL